MTATKRSSDTEGSKNTRRSNRDASERKHGCDVCKRRFFTRKDVKRHQVVHTGSRQFVCCLCRHAFGRKDHLVRHEKKVHPQLNKGVLTPVLINDQLSFGIILPVTQEITSALNSNHRLPGDASFPDNLPASQNENLPSIPSENDMKLSDSEPGSPSLDSESLTLTLGDWVHFGTTLSNVDMATVKDKNIEGNVTPSPEEAMSTPSPGGFDSGLSDCTASPGSTSGSSILGDPNDFLNGIDFVEDLSLHDIDLETVTGLYPLETEDYLTYLN